MKMHIIISSEILENNSLSPNELVYLYHLLNKHLIPDYCNPIDIQKLEKLGFVKQVKDVVYPRAYAIKELFPKESPKIEESTDEEKEQKREAKRKEVQEWFDQLVEAYPKKHNGRVLRNKSVALPKFLKALTEGHTLDNMLKGLEIEKARREAALSSPILSERFFPAPKNLATWIHQRTWMDYLEDDEEEPSSSESNVRRL